MTDLEAYSILYKACQSKKQKEAFNLLLGNRDRKSQYKCHYYHEICSHCLNYPTPEDIEADKADDCCTEYEIAANYMAQEDVRKSGQCRYFMEY